MKKLVMAITMCAVAAVVNAALFEEAAQKDKQCSRKPVEGNRYCSQHGGK